MALREAAMVHEKRAVQSAPVARLLRNYLVNIRETGHVAERSVNEDGLCQASKAPGGRILTNLFFNILYASG
jgi:hypothetical protein